MTILSLQIDLKVLTFLGLGIGVVSGVISQLTKTSEDVQGSTKKKLTSAGKFALALSMIGFSGSFASEIFKNAIDATEAADKKRREEDEKLWKQRSTELSTEILAKTKEAVKTGLNTRFQIQETQQKVIADNTGRTRKILESIWTESHRVSPQDIRVQIRYVFLSDFSDEFPPPQKVFESNCRLSIRAQTAPKAKKLIPNEWKSDHLIGAKDADLLLIADEPAITQTVSASTAGPSIGQVNDFLVFRGEMGPLDSELKWNGTTVEIHLTGTSPRLKGEVFSKSMEEAQFGIETLKNHYDLTQALKLIDHADYAIQPLPIYAEATLFIHGRPLAKSTATLVIAKEWDEDVRSFIVAKFPLITIGKDSFTSPFARIRAD